MEPQGRRARVPEVARASSSSARERAPVTPKPRHDAARRRRARDARRRRARRARAARRVALAAAARARVARGARGRRARSRQPTRPSTASTPRSAPTPASRFPQTSSRAYQLRAVRARAVGVGPRHPTRRGARDDVRARCGHGARRLRRFARRARRAGRDAQRAACIRVVPRFGSIGVADLAAALAPRAAADRRRRSRIRGRDACRAPTALHARRARAGRARRQGRPRAHQRQRRDRRTRGAGAAPMRRSALDALNVAASRCRSRDFAPTSSPLDPRVAGGARRRRARPTSRSGSRRCSPAARSGDAGAARRVQDPAVVALRHAGARRARSPRCDRGRDDVEIELEQRRRQPAGARRRRRDAVQRQLPLAGARAGLRRAAASRSRKRRALCVERCQRCHVAGAHRPAAAADAPRSRALGLRDDPEDADRAVRNEIRHLANPASLDFLPVSESVEDHAPMALRRRREAAARSSSACATWSHSSCSSRRRQSTCARSTAGALGTRRARGVRSGARARRVARRRSPARSRRREDCRRARALPARLRRRRRDDLAAPQLGPGGWSRSAEHIIDRADRARDRVRHRAARSASGRRATTASTRSRSAWPASSTRFPRSRSLRC